MERTKCPACGSDDLDCRYDRPFADPPIRDFLERYYAADVSRFAANRFRLDRCPRCTLLFQRWVGDDALLATLYGEWIAREGNPESDPVYQRDMANPKWSRDAHEIITAARFLGKSPTELRVLDYGMGWALWARIAKSLGCHVFGVELSADRRQFAEANGISLISDRDMGDCQFDFINTDQLMEHVVQPGETCLRLAHALSSGGILKISVPNGEGAEQIVKRLNAAPSEVTDAELMPVQPLEHVNCFNECSIAALAKHADLDLVRPTLAQRYAFVASPSAIPRQPKQLLKELVRPFYTFRNPANLYRWLRKRSLVRGRP